MSELDNVINGLLTKVQNTNSKDKGVLGEQAVFSICEKFYQTEGGILIHSYSYRIDKSQKGNIKRDGDRLYVENTGSTTEIDVLYVSKYRVFPIEVKTYRAKKITFDRKGIYGCSTTDKSPVHQNEMHMRHLYQFMFRAYQKGSTKFDCPIVCMTDRCTIEDKRPDWQKDYIKLCTLDGLAKLIEKENKPIGYQLDLGLVNNLLKENMVSSTIYLPPRM